MPAAPEFSTVMPLTVTPLALTRIPLIAPDALIIVLAAPPLDAIGEVG